MTNFHEHFFKLVLWQFWKVLGGTVMFYHYCLLYNVRHASNLKPNIKLEQPLVTLLKTITVPGYKLAYFWGQVSATVIF